MLTCFVALILLLGWLQKCSSQALDITSSMFTLNYTWHMTCVCIFTSNYTCLNAILNVNEAYSLLDLVQKIQPSHFPRIDFIHGILAFVLFRVCVFFSFIVLVNHHQHVRTKNKV